MKTKPDLGINDPYELTEEQFDAAVNLLKQQKPLIEEVLGARLGRDRPVQERRRRHRRLVAVPDEHAPGRQGRRSKDLIPDEGATGWADTWMLSSKSKHPNCAYLWMK